MSINPLFPAFKSKKEDVTDCINYNQADTTAVINQLRSAERKTSVSYLRNALSAGHQRLSEMDSLILRLLTEYEALRADNERLSKMVDDLESRPKSRKQFDYNAFVRDFYTSGKTMMRVRIDKKSSVNGGLWYTPNASKVRLAANRLGLPIDAQQRTGSKNENIPPIMIVYRTDVEDENETVR